MNALPSPDDAASRLEAAGDGDAAALIRAMQAELALVRGERDRLAEFTRLIAGLLGSEMSHNSTLIVRAKQALDTLRVTERCTQRESGQHSWMRREPVFGSRCFSCHARRPGT
ncbi:hypothetical protein [Streptomyces caniscabiei]|uniref:Uncharacterized protein n=1 Tax=Streptomyces caniscabiei TaxID=2746961 RepID=A0ABU4MYY7_9ACTN|nr:hypothetical protein [Streptomyces caniscabiei]MBE4790324.1 hypothetical protein [Streptomyces caniscabiei]MBE4799447.1 hypothetical protein [Streptomyces caniscabiei]MDX3015181.1 hypothetical protein [Streptomyces caniscabiei]MDX3042624.1 hypothetical protein [Streptomyces caniscabiei]